MVKKYLFLTGILLIALAIWGQDMDFGIFNYKDSRLKSIKRYGGEKLKFCQEIKYEYDEKGYLKRRILGYPGLKKKDLIYETKIDYNLEENIIYEKFDRNINGKIFPAYLEYYYDKNKRLVRLVRKEKGRNDNDPTISSDLEIQYNEKGDVIYIKDHYLKIVVPDFVFFPTSGVVYRPESTFKYEYLENKKTRYAYLDTNNKEFKYIKNKTTDDYYNRHEFIFEGNKLVKIINHPLGVPEEKSSTEEFKYDNNNNLIESIFTYINNFVLPKPRTEIWTEKIKYEYDKKNRLIKRIRYYIDKASKNDVKEIEEYYYEDGNYVYYAYLLPPKIIVYNTQMEEPLIDKFMF